MHVADYMFYWFYMTLIELDYSTCAHFFKIDLFSLYVDLTSYSFLICILTEFTRRCKL